MSASATSIRSTGKEFQSLIVFEKCSAVDGTVSWIVMLVGSMEEEMQVFIYLWRTVK